MPLFRKSKLKNKLFKSSEKISKGLAGIFTGKKLTEEELEELEELLIISDISMDIISVIIKKLRKNKYNKNVDLKDIKQIISNELASILKEQEEKLEIDKEEKPFVILFVGVNASGKTTTIGKIAHKLREERKNVMIAACDTFRAGAVEQLRTWAMRSGAEFMHPEKTGTDPASIAFKALQKARDEKFDVLLIDTAGRLQNNANLMEELSKIVKVLKKIDSNTPHKTIIVLDATIGQNSKKQLELFEKAVPIDGIIMNKLDGTAKGGILISIANSFKKPIYAIGVGEKTEDLTEFDSKNFVNSLLEI